MGLYDFTFYDLIRRNAQCFRNKPAWFEVDQNRTVSFLEIQEAVDRIACGLHALGLQKGDRIGVIGKNSLEFFLLYGAAAALGAILLPVNWRLSANEVCFNLNDCTPTVLFSDPEYQEMVFGIQNSLPSIKHYGSLRQPGVGFESFDAVTAGQDDVDFSKVSVSNDDGFVIIHTAAVTGTPRGALLSHLNLMCADIHFNHALNMTPDDVHLNLLPLFHVGGLFMATSSFHAGALTVNMSKFDARKAVSLIEEKSVSFLFDFSPILSGILDEHGRTGKNIRSLRAVVGLDSPETIERYQQTTGGMFYCLYGQTETSCLATIGPYADCPGAAGKPVPMGDIRLVDDYDRPLPTGEVGEITVKGPLVFRGYWNLPDDNERIFRNGWHHTGDLGRFDAEGYLWYAGRKAEKELIKPGGENVYPTEVEKVILTHPAVDQVVVFGVPDPKWKEGIKAVCRLKAYHHLDARQLIEFVGDRIARYKKPQYVEFIDVMPISADGSPDREKIKSLYGGPQDPPE